MKNKRALSSMTTHYLVLRAGELRYHGINAEFAHKVLPEGSAFFDDVFASYRFVDDKPVGDLYFNAHRAVPNEQFPVQDPNVKGASFPLNRRFASGSIQDSLATRVLKIIGSDARHLALVRSRGELDDR